MSPFKLLTSGLAAGSAAIVAVLFGAQPAWANATLTASPKTVQAGETISITGSGFTSCLQPQSLVVRWDRNPLALISLKGPDASGNFTAEAIVPPSSPGGHRVDAGCAKLPQHWPDAYPYVVTLTASQQTVRAGQPVTITGNGFDQCITDTETGDMAVLVSAAGNPPAAVSGSDGSFTAVVTVPADAPAGPYPVTAQCPDQSAGDPTSVTVYIPGLNLSPSPATPGETISVTGDGYTQCKAVQAQLLQDAARLMATKPAVPADGRFSVGLTVPSDATPGGNYRVDAGCYPAEGSLAVLASSQLTVTSVAPSASSPPSSALSSSPPPSSALSSSPTPSPALGSPSPSTVTSPHYTSHSDGRWSPVALVGGMAGGFALAAILLLVRASPLVRGRRNRRWAHRHLRAVAGSAALVSVQVQRRPGAVSASVGLQPHLDRPGHQQYEEVAR